jgi:UDP-N-acetylmuramate: L-alanyl-gamma-D-glutamyl-meso-diaminopimelate ligase
LPYQTPEYQLEEDSVALIDSGKKYSMQVFGRHNMQNIMGAKLICNQLGVNDGGFYEAVSRFRGAGKRLQLLGQKAKTAIYMDFAHSPSKVEATVKAVREQFPNRKLFACLELHTYSSLNRNFLGHYGHTMDNADAAIVYFNPQTILHKRLEMITAAEVKRAFQLEELLVFTEKDELEKYFGAVNWNNAILLLMSSGNFSGIDFNTLVKKILGNV